jgi:arabinofuranosyltransferase
MSSAVYKAALGTCFLILLSGAVLQTLAGSAFLTTHSHNDWGNDDAYIGYRYAGNLARGQGLVFNRGERVEGYSDLLYVLMMVPAFWLTNRDGVYFFSVLVDLIFALTALALFAWHLRRKFGEPAALGGSLLFVLCLPLWVAVASGLETCEVLFITLALWILSERVAAGAQARDLAALCGLIVLAVFSRVDAFLVCGMVALYLLIKRRVRPALACAATLVMTQGLYEMGRKAYYGAWLPTTYYIKVAGPLWDRFHHAAVQFTKINFFGGLLPYTLIFLFAAVGAAASALRGWREFADALRFDALFAPLWLAYWFWIGGDHFWDRFLIILYPLGIFALFSAWRGIEAPRMAIFGVLLLAAFQAGPPWYIDPRFDYRFSKYDCWVGLGKFLGDQFPGRTLAVEALGKIPFFSGLHAMDMMGVADLHIAHMAVATSYYEPGHIKFDSDYTLSLRPDLIVLEISPNRDMGLRMTRAKYEGAGYRLEYLADTRRPPRAQRIVAVQGMSEAAVSGLIADGYDYAVAARKDIP